MANDLPLTIVMGPLPPNVAYTPQELADAIASRLIIQTQQTFALFVSGSTEPSYNVGPWLKDGTTWYVWDYVTGSYVPQNIPPASLGYIIGAVEPDPALYNFWIETDVLGDPMSIKIYTFGAWLDVYSDAFAEVANNLATALTSYLTIANAATTYQTIAGMSAYLTTATAAATYQTIAGMSAYLTSATAAATYQTLAGMASYPTTTDMNNAIAAATFAPYPAQATKATQSIPATNTDTKVTLDATTFNPAPAPFNTGSNRYIAPAAGYYNVSAIVQFANDTADAATMETKIVLYKNGADAGLVDFDNTPSPNGGLWTPGFTGTVQLATNDYLELYAAANDTPGSGNVNLTVRAFSVNRISQ